MLRFRFLSLGDQFLQSKAAIVLWPLSWVWRLGSWLRSLLPVQRVTIPVVSVGNLSVGGTGKTPFVILLGKQFSHRRIAILSRGYGGDEMQIIRRRLPHALCYEGKDRVRLAIQAVRDGAELILLDDGFQYRRLYRDFDCVLTRPQDFVDRVMPSGKLREPLRALKRADVVFGPLSIQVRRVVDLRGQEVSLFGENVAIFCGIANPERFKKTVESLGANICYTIYLADHEPADLSKLKRLSVKHLVCTEKDAVKLPKTDLPILVVEIDAYPALETEKWHSLVEKIGKRMNN